MTGQAILGSRILEELDTPEAAQRGNMEVPGSIFKAGGMKALLVQRPPPKRHLWKRPQADPKVGMRQADSEIRFPTLTPSRLRGFRRGLP